MAKQIKTRKGKDDYYYPYTSPDLVIDNTGKSATTRFEEIEDNQLNLIEDGTTKGIKDTEYDTLTTTNKTVIGSINELSAQFKDIAKKIEQGGIGGKGDDGIGIKSVVQTTTSIEDGGNNVITVTKTDNTTSTFTVKNGSKGDPGEKGDPGDKGDKGDPGSDANVTSANVISALTNKLTLGIYTDGLIYLFVDGSPVGTGIEQTGETGDVVGNVDSDKNITLTGNLAAGTYTLKYEMDDGSTVNIGTLNINVINYTNLVPTSVTNDGVTIYNGNGYKNGVRLRTDGIQEADLAGQFATGFIPVTSGDVIRIKRATYNNNFTKIVGYDSSFATRLDEFYTDGWGSSYWTITEKADGTLMCVLKANNTIKWARFTAVGDGSNIIITKNEEIK